MNVLDGVGNHPSGRALAGPLPPTSHSPALQTWTVWIESTARQWAADFQISLHQWPAVKPVSRTRLMGGAVAKIPAKNHIFLGGSEVTEGTEEAGGVIAGRLVQGAEGVPAPREDGIGGNLRLFRSSF